ncbi:MAG: AAA family ATPase [Bacteroidota bacterium]
MKYRINKLLIKNFKSVKDLKLDCSRINLFIGEPNIGKSNILEALSLYGFSFDRSNEKFMSDFIRYEHFADVFYDQSIEEPLAVLSELGAIWIEYNYETSSFDFKTGNIQNAKDNEAVSTEDLNAANLPSIQTDKNVILEKKTINLQESGKLNSQIDYRLTIPVKKYRFSQGEIDDTKNGLSLFPPHGNNLFRTIQTHGELKEEIAELLEYYGLRLQLNTLQKKLEIVKTKGNISYTLPYISTADTLRRIIFYYAAILSNKNSVLLFEEPESHFFPPYIRDLAFKIIENIDNQYFIATHSPQLFNTLIEKTPEKDLSVFVTFSEDQQTKVRKLTGEDLSELLDYGVNVFSNISRYTHEHSTTNIS